MKVASSEVDSGVAAAREQAERAHVDVSEISGWNVTVSRHRDRPDVTAVPVKAVEGTTEWTVVADSVEGDRLITPRAIGTDAIVRGSNGRLVDGGVVIEDAVVTTRKTTVRAARVVLTLPNKVELTDVGKEVQRAE